VKRSSSRLLVLARGGSSVWSASMRGGTGAAHNSASMPINDCYPAKVWPSFSLTAWMRLWLCVGPRTARTRPGRPTKDRRDQSCWLAARDNHAPVASWVVFIRKPFSVITPAALPRGVQRACAPVLNAQHAASGPARESPEGCSDAYYWVCGLIQAALSLVLGLGVEKGD
jgi:hypothetical protein